MGPTNYSHRPRQTSIQPDPRLSYRVYLRVGLQAWHYLTPQAILQVNCHLHFTVYLPVHPTVCRHLTSQVGLLVAHQVLPLCRHLTRQANVPLRLQAYLPLRRTLAPSKKSSTFPSAAPSRRPTDIPSHALSGTPLESPVRPPDKTCQDSSDIKTKQKNICETIKDSNRVKKCTKVGIFQACPKACNACGPTGGEVCQDSLGVMTKQKSICKTIRDKNRVKKCRKVGVLQACPKACNACGLTSREVCRSSAFKKNSNRCKAVACCKWKKGQCRPKDAKGECFPPYGP